MFSGSHSGLFWGFGVLRLPPPADVVSHLTEGPDGPEPVWHVHCYISSQASGRDRKWLRSMGMPRVGVVAFFGISGRELSALHSDGSGGLCLLVSA